MISIGDLYTYNISKPLWKDSSISIIGIVNKCEMFVILDCKQINENRGYLYILTCEGKLGWIEILFAELKKVDYGSKTS